MAPRAFDLALPGLEVALEAARRAYPREACGLGFSLRGGAEVTRWRVLANRAADPRRRFVFDPAEHLAALSEADRDGLVVRVIFHSHPDAPPRLSEADRAAAVVGGIALYPGVLHLVVSTTARGPAAWAAHRFEGGQWRSTAVHPA